MPGSDSTPDDYGIFVRTFTPVAQKHAVALCPVCKGHGCVYAGFYDLEYKAPGTPPEPCRGCWGAGWVCV